MKKILFLAIIAFWGPVMAQNQELMQIWNSRTSSEERKSPGTAFEKAQSLKRTLEKKKRGLSLIDEFAYRAMAFEASTEKAKVANEAEIVLKLRQFEALTFSMSVQMDTLYPGILGWYQNFDAKWSRFRFNTEPVQPIGFADMAESAGESEPTDAVEAIRFHTANIQRELFQSKNLVISKDYERMMRIYWSLEDSVRSIVDRQGYPSFWKEQLACFANKSANKAWACECGFKKNPVFESEKGCIGKNISLHRTVALQDPKTSILVRLVDGNLKATREATDAMLTTWGNVQNSIPSQIIFWWCVELGVTKPSDQMRINFRKLWAEGRNDYNLAIGLDSATVAGLEDYLVCRLGIKAVSVSETSIRPVMVTEESSTVLQNATISEKKDVPPTGKTSQKNAGTATRTAAPRKPLPKYDIAKLREAVDADVQQELENREGLHACAETRTVNDTTIELELHGCGSAEGTFEVMQVETPLAGGFFNYCSNILSGQLKSFREQLGGTYQVTVVGTADRLTYAKNQELADQRAEFVKKNLGKKMIADIGGLEHVLTVGLIDQDERKVILRVVLINPGK